MLRHGIFRPGLSLGARRGEVVVCIPVFGAVELFSRALRSVLAHSPSNAVILIADDASPGSDIEDAVEAIARECEQRVELMRQPVNVGFVANVNAVFAAAHPADVVVVNSDVEVADGWLERLRDAAYSDELVATATALTNHGTIVTVPDRDAPSDGLPPGRTLDELAAAIARASRRVRPTIPTAVGHCVYVRRSALELAGGFDPTFSPGYGEEVDFSQRCAALGFTHVVADDVYVLHHGGGSFTADRSPIRAAHERIIDERYPYYAAAVKEASVSNHIPLARSLAAARLQISDLTVTVDGACLGPDLTGTYVHAIELIAALARRDDIRLRVTVPRSLNEHARSVLEEHGVEYLRHDSVDQDVGATDIVHRPYQITSPRDVPILRALGRRLVLTQQDLIAYRNPTYFASWEDWNGYRELTRRALALADRAAFFSEHAARDALREDLVDDRRAVVVPIGVDHRVVPVPSSTRVPERGGPLLDRPFLLSLGTDFSHKNRPFALKLFTELRRGYGFDGRLVLAGPKATRGTSAANERAWRAADPDSASHVIDLGPVTEEEKGWLYGETALVLYPTIREGFGLVPFEAAERGAPTLWAPHSSLVEVLPREHARIVPWDVEASAGAAARLLADAGERDRLAEAVRTAAARYTWDRCAEQFVSMYRDLAVSPGRTMAEPAESLPQLAWALVGPHGWIPPDVQQALLAVSTRRRLRAPVFAGLKAGYRMLYRARRLRSNSAS
jgi:glycosyltransferase involved in cell wall biosynthesis